MRAAVVVFPGSNCDRDVYHVLKNVFGLDCHYVFYEEQFTPTDFDLIVLPGGFSFGDYLRPGAIARFSPVMQSVRRASEAGKFIMGICNGFQILTEVGLLTGTLLKNTNLRFICKEVYVKVVNNETPFTCLFEKGEVVRLPIAHGEGRYFSHSGQLRPEQIVLQYCDRNGETTEMANPNGSYMNIAGIINEKKNVFGLMPHPERCCEDVLGNTDGRKFFESILTYTSRRRVYAAD